MNGLNGILEAFENMRANDTFVEKKAENDILEFMRQPESITAFIKIMSECDVPVYRQMAALFLRKIINIYWNNIDEQTQQMVKDQLLSLMQSEQYELARKAICGVVSVLAQSELKQNRWTEVLTHMNNLLYSQSAEERELGMLMLFSLHETIRKYVSTENLYSVLNAGMNDTAGNVGLMAVKAAVDVITSFIDEDDITCFSPLIPQFLHILEICIQEQDNDIVNRIFGLFEDTSLSSTPFIDNYLNYIVEACCQCLASNALFYSMRMCAGSCLDELCRHYNTAIQSNNLLPSILTVVLSNISEGANESNEDDNDTPSHICERILNTISSHFNAQEITNKVTSFAIPRLSSSLWQERRSGVVSLFIIIESCYDVLVTNYSEYAMAIRPLLHDPIPCVSKRAVYFFTESLDYIPGAVMSYAPWLVEECGNMMNEGSLSSIYNGLLLLESVSLELDNDVKKSLLTLMPMLLAHVQNEQLTLEIRTLAMSCITCVVMKTKEAFLPYLNESLSVALNILPTTGDDSIIIRRRALEFIGKVIIHIGYEYVSQHMQFIADQIAILLNEGETSFAQTAFNFFEVLADNIEVDNPSYKIALCLLNAYLPVMINIIQSDSDIHYIHRKKANEEFGNLGSTFDSVLDSSEDENALITSGGDDAVKKEYAIDAVISICRNIEVLLDAYYEDVVNALLEATDHIHESVRAKAYEGLEEMLDILYGTEEEIPWDNGEYDYSYSETIESLIKNYMNILLPSLRVEEETSVVMPMLSLFDSMVNTLGPAFLIPYLQNIFTLLSDLIQDKLISQQHYLEQNAIIVGVERANSHPIATAAIDVLSSIIEVLGANESLLDKYQLLWNNCTVYLTEWNSSDDIISCYACASSLLETFNSRVSWLVGDVMKMIPKTTNYYSEYCRANTYYLLGLLIENFANELHQYIEKIAMMLQEGLQGKPDDKGRACDNAVCALVKLETAYPQQFTETILSLILPHVPLQIDTIDEDKVLAFIMQLYETNGSLFSKYADKILHVYACYIDPTIDTYDDYKALIAGQLEDMRKASPQFFEQIREALNDYDNDCITEAIDLN